MAVDIHLEWTPNPSTLKYVVSVPLLPRGAMNFTSRAEAEAKSPLAARLFAIAGVAAVMLGTDFLTVTKEEDGDWDVLNDGVMEALDEHLGAGGVVVDPQALEAWLSAAAAAGGSDLEARVREILDSEIRPAVAMDGGDITLERVENGTVYVNMQGSCSGCPSSTATLRMGIETRLREAIPGLLEVVAV